jgi:hypothetical protein
MRTASGGYPASDHLRALVATSSANAAGLEISNVRPSDSYFDGGHGGPIQVSTPVVTGRHSAISSLRASATIIVVLRAPLGS